MVMVLPQNYVSLAGFMPTSSQSNCFFVNESVFIIAFDSAPQPPRRQGHAKGNP